MKVNVNNNVRRFQEGGPMPVEGAPMEEAPMGPEGAAPAEGGGDPTAQLQQAAQEIISQLGPEAAMALAQMIMEMAQGGGGEAPAPEQPVMQRQGGRLRRLF